MAQKKPLLDSSTHIHSESPAENPELVNSAPSLSLENRSSNRKGFACAGMSNT